jgi:hypothetical protein
VQISDVTGTRLNSRLWLVLGLAGIAARLLLWFSSIGSNDVYYWLGHAHNVAINGIADAYTRAQMFNHPPLPGLYSAQAWWWSEDNEIAFARLIKLPGLLGEAISLWALWRFAGPRAFAAYACLPAAILLSGFHGNTDCLYAAFVLVSAIAFDRESFFFSGLLFAAALNVKVLPLFLLPLPLIALPDRRAFWRFTAGLSLGMIPFLPPALTAGGAMYRNMIAYNSNSDNWGVLILFRQGRRIQALAPLLDMLGEWYRALGRYLIGSAMVAIALVCRFRHKLPMTQQAALGAAIFLLFTPGFGVQYIALACPLLCMVDLRAGIRWGWASGAFLAIVYWHSLEPGLPLKSLFRTAFPFQAWAVGAVAWCILLQFAWTHRPAIAPATRLR